MPLKERAVLITGASSGIGRACAVAFARAGYGVCGFARNDEKLESLGAEIANLPAGNGGYLSVVGDVRRADDVEAAVARAVQRFGRLDVLVANAGVGYSGTVVDAEWDDLQTVIDTNISGVLHGIRAVAPQMRAQGGGHIMIVSSVVARVHTPYTAVYSASKAFVSSLAGALRLEIEDDNIQVTDLLVGRTATDFSANRLGPVRKTMSGLPTQSAEDVADAIVRAARRKPKRLAFSCFDRLALWGGVLAPGLMARAAKKQYQPDE